MSRADLAALFALVVIAPKMSDKTAQVAFVVFAVISAVSKIGEYAA